MTTIAIASGKGGTGKTTVATNLAIVAAARGLRVQLLDCDVEEPDCALFLDPKIESTETVHVLVPEVDDERCTRCGVCADVCEFKAIVALPSTVLVFPELCHACGACALLCPEKAIAEVPRRTGVVQLGHARGVATGAGVLDIGEAKAPPVIRAVKGHADERADLVLIDAPPGTSCPVIESVRGADLVLLVSEPTPFGLHDLKLAVEAMRALGLPFALVANRADVGDDRLREYCRREGIETLAEIPDDRRLAEAYSRGEPAVTALPEYEELFADILRRALELAGAAERGPVSEAVS